MTSGPRRRMVVDVVAWSERERETLPGSGSRSRSGLCWWLTAGGADRDREAVGIAAVEVVVGTHDDVERTALDLVAEAGAVGRRLGSGGGDLLEVDRRAGVA